jgi:hypothetical protein
MTDTPAGLVHVMQALGGGEGAGKDAVDATDHAGFHRLADMRFTPRAAAVVGGTGPNAGRRAVLVSGHNRGLAGADEDQTFRGECLNGMTHDANPNALQRDQFGNGRQLVA